MKHNALHRHAFYYTVHKHGEDILLYENIFSSIVKTRVYKLNTGDGRNIIKDSCACHNFSPFLGKDGKFYALAGQDSWKNDLEWYGMKAGKEFKDYFSERFGHEYKRDDAVAYEVISKINMLRSPLKHTKGLYLFSSADGYEWKQDGFEPVITVKSQGFNSSLAWKSSEFDGHIWVQFHNGKYFLFIRENQGKEKRFIQYSTSEDLREWTDFKSIDIENENGVNYYYMVGREYEGGFLCFVPAYTNTESYIKVFTSKDLEKFEFVENIFVDGVASINGKNKNKHHPVNGGYDGYIFIHHNYHGYDGKDVIVKRYRIEDLI